MIETTGDPSGLVTGWLKRYLEITKGTRFPASFHLLCGIFALSSTMGRKACIRRGGFRLFPPTSIFLLGSSGVGKSKALQTARMLVRMVAEDRPGFSILHASSFTTRGLMEAWGRAQADSGLGYLEGIVTVNEASAILTAKTGTETMAQWIIDLLEHENIEDWTGKGGHAIVKNVTVALGICSTVDYLRKAITVDQFAGGLMHRFLIAHETTRPDVDERPILNEEIHELADGLRAIVTDPPEYMQVSKEADILIAAFGRQAERRNISSAYLSGFWNRYSMMLARVGGIFALSDGGFCIERKHIEAADLFLKRFIYPPLEAFVIEMSYGGKQQALFRLADELFLAGEKGLSEQEFKRKMPTTSGRTAQEMLDFLISLGVVSWRPKSRMADGWVWRFEKWKQ